VNGFARQRLDASLRGHERQEDRKDLSSPLAPAKAGAQVRQTAGFERFDERPTVRDWSAIGRPHPVSQRSIDLEEQEKRP